MKVFIYGVKLKTSDLPYVETLLTVLANHQTTLAIYGPYCDDLKSAGLNVDCDKHISTYDEVKSFEPAIIMTLGGDGTILSAATLIKDLQFPIIGVNLGRLGFLSNVEKEYISDAVEQIVNGNYYIDARTMLELDCTKPIFSDYPYALNDFTMLKRDTSSMVTIHTYIDGVFLNSYWADGLVVSTPTGSTGYSLSCGGPIVFPNSGNIVITPVAPHNLNVRPIVISDNSEVRFEIEGRSENFLCTLDARFETITSEHKITVRKCGFKLQLAQLKDKTFMNTIREKLMWGHDKRNH